MPVAGSSHRPAARRRRAAACALAALALVLALVGATFGSWAPAPVASIGARRVHVSVPTITGSGARARARTRHPLARLVRNGPHGKAGLGGRAPTPTSAVRPRGDGGAEGRVPEFFGLDPAARCLAPAATAALLDRASGARIASLHERAFQITTPREPNPARGPPLA